MVIELAIEKRLKLAKKNKRKDRKLSTVAEFKEDYSVSHMADDPVIIKKRRGVDIPVREGGRRKYDTYKLPREVSDADSIISDYSINKYL